LCRTRYEVTAESNRMGYRLRAEEPLPRETGEMISDATWQGALQVPPSGQPILLMADRQVTGGYPIIATVIAADLPVVGQLAPGDWIEFDGVHPRRRGGRARAPSGSRMAFVREPSMQSGVPLAPRSSLRVGGPARWFTVASSPGDVGRRTTGV
jgi:allophanate hydrolase subunit 2